VTGSPGAARRASSGFDSAALISVPCAKSADACSEAAAAEAALPCDASAPLRLAAMDVLDRLDALPWTLVESWASALPPNASAPQKIKLEIFIAGLLFVPSCAAGVALRLGYYNNGRGGRFIPLRFCRPGH
jgi:hypothetical protein